MDRLCRAGDPMTYLAHSSSLSTATGFVYHGHVRTRKSFAAQEIARGVRQLSTCGAAFVGRDVSERDRP
jgi:hypothetical protein